VPAHRRGKKTPERGQKVRATKDAKKRETKQSTYKINRAKRSSRINTHGKVRHRQIRPFKKREGKHIKSIPLNHPAGSEIRRTGQTHTTTAESAPGGRRCSERAHNKLKTKGSEEGDNFH